MKKLIVGNWKLYINTPTDAKKLFSALDRGLPKKLTTIVAICPQVSLATLLKSSYRGKRIAIGTQDVSSEDSGAHTGSVSAQSLASVGLNYVIVGHAERRAEGDTDDVVSKKAATAIRSKLHPIICVGEPARDSEGGHFSYLAENVVASLSRIDSKDAARFTIAYDPLWAIGVAEAPSARIVAEAIMYIRKTIVDMWGRERAQKVRIIYGGSVNRESARQFATEDTIQGLLVGRASVGASDFIEIVKVFS